MHPCHRGNNKKFSKRSLRSSNSLHTYIHTYIHTYCFLGPSAATSRRGAREEGGGVYKHRGDFADHRRYRVCGGPGILEAEGDEVFNNVAYAV